MRTLRRHARFLVGLLVSLAVLAPFFLYSLYLGRSNAAYVNSLCAEHTCGCGDWYRRSEGEYQIENNVWNKAGAGAYRQCVFIEQGDQGISAGWAWNWPGMRFNVVAYPNIMVGKNPWLSPTTMALPIRVGDIDCLEADFEVVQQGSGKGNLSFDLWITDSESAEPETISREIMIWLYREGFWTAGSRQDTMELEGREIGFWKKEDHSPSDELAWTYLAFVYKTPLTEGTIDLNQFLSYLVENGHISADEYLASIQLGNEIVSGYGQTLVQNYRVRLFKK